MSVSDLKVSIRGVVPLIMHRYAGEQPSAPKAPRGKKTQQWIDEQHKNKWLTAAYFDRGTFHIPPENVEAMLANGAKEQRKGMDFKRCVGVVEHFIPLLVYSDEEDKKGRHLSGKLEDFFVKEHIDIRPVVIQKARVDACRPIFRHWGLEFTVRFDTAVITEKDILSAMEQGGLGDFRPRYGRFKVEQNGISHKK